ncbi:ribonuclease HII [Halobacillus yeomjeoni]|nr:ribonuclease HII [Halobacillus yeomjeoni]
MASMTISEVKQKMKDEEFTQTEIEALRQDGRKGVQKLIQQYDAAQEKQRLQKVKYEEMKEFEKHAWQRGCQLVAGIDEAGRGPLAGPVVAGAVILPDGYYLEGLNDSKLLSLAKREEFFKRIKQDADYGVGIVTNEEIDEINIYNATKLAMQRAVASLNQNPDHLLIDAVDLEEVDLPQTNLVKGDQRSVSIAAASVIAKVTRDHLMAEYDIQYPMYRFSSNQGYGTKEHVDALKAHGPSPFHRKSFAPVKEYTYV